jgi:hypothetical protein
MMNFVGPSRDDPVPRTTSQKVFGAGFFVAALFATSIVLLAVYEAIPAADTTLELKTAFPGFALVIVCLVVCGYVMTLIHW